MGRSYSQELSELAATLAAVPASASEHVAEQAARAAECGLVVVASGGARVVAEWACRLHRLVFGSAASALTPLEYCSIATPVVASTWLLSAGGRHSDIHEAAKVARSRGDRSVVGVIGQSGSPLEAWLRTELRSPTVSLNLASGLDGFLATNSVWSMACTIARAYARWLPDGALAALDADSLERLLAWARKTVVDLVPWGDRDLIVLHDTWAALGAQDLETRMIEAALGNFWAADFRNFAHGRHFWLADRPERSAVVALWTPSAEPLAMATLDGLPPQARVYRQLLPGNDIVGALASLAFSIHLTARWASATERDPGRPGVPAFGERLYEGGFPYPMSAVLDRSRLAVRRKSSAASTNEAHWAKWRSALDAFRAQLANAQICGVVFDYDGTLVDTEHRFSDIHADAADQLNRLLGAGLWIGIATGRGDSVHCKLRVAVNPVHWPHVIIGYHNGAVVRSLQEEVPDLDAEPSDGTFSAVAAALRSRLEQSGLASLRVREHQITVNPVAGSGLAETWRATRECLDVAGFKETRVWLSSHSVDVLSGRCSKLHVVDAVASAAGCDSAQVLRIGDRGAWPGNDWELLSSPLGLSVDECSSDSMTCWNMLPIDVRGAAATVRLLRHISPIRPGIAVLTNEDLDA